MSGILLEWVGSNLASTVVSRAGDMAFTQLLSAIGIETSQEGQIVSKLEEMNGKLDLIVREIGRISGQISQLAGQVAIEMSEVQTLIQNVAIGDAVTSIETRYYGHALGSTPTLRAATPPTAAAAPPTTAGAPITDVASLLSRRIKGETFSRGSLQNFANNILVTWQVPVNVSVIGRALAGDPGGGLAGLLWAWTELFSLKMERRTKSARLASYYALLEQYFLRYLGAQLLGVSLVAMAKSVNTPAGKVSSDAVTYVEGYGQSLRSIGARFLQCVERLALQQGQFRSPAPLEPGKKRMEGAELFLGVPEDVTGILLRAELLGAMLLESVKTPEYRDAIEGVLVHLFCREGDVNAQHQGPELNPWGVKSRGRALPAPGITLPTWGASADRYAELLPRSPGASVRLVRYFWPFSSIGETAGDPGFYAWDTALRNMDLATLAIVPRDQPEPERRAAMAYIADFSRTRSGYPTVGTTDSVWQVGSVEGQYPYNTQVTKDFSAGKHPLRPDDAYSRCVLKFKLEQDQRFGLRTTTWRVQAPLFKHTVGQGTAKDQLKLHMWISAMAAKGPLLDQCFMAAKLVVSLRTPGGDMKLFDSSEVDGGRLNLWGRFTGQLRSESIAQELTFTIPVGGHSGVDTFDLVLEAEVRHQYQRTAANTTWASVEATIKDLSVWWP